MRSGLTWWYIHCVWRLSPVILHCAVVCPHNVTLTHWWVNGEYCLVGTCKRTHYSLGLLVSNIESYHNPISLPGNSGSRSTSRSAGEGPRLVTKSQTSYSRWTCRTASERNREQLVCFACDKFVVKSNSTCIILNLSQDCGYDHVYIQDNFQRLFASLSVM